MMSIKVPLFVGILVACVLVSLAVGVVVGIIYRKKVAESTIGSAQQEATRILNEAVSKAESKKKEAILTFLDQNGKVENISIEEIIAPQDGQNLRIL